MLRILYLLRALCLFAMLALLAVNANAVPETSPIAAPGAQLERISSGYGFTEGPACDSHGDVYFTDQPNDRIYQWHARTSKVTLFKQGTGRANGLCFDAHGALWACADAHNALWCIAPDGKVAVVIAGHNGKRLNGPNDVWIRPDGGLYLTDPFYVRSYWDYTQKEQDTEGVYYLPLGAARLVRVIGDFVQPNGLIGTPDGKTLYVADIGANKTYSYTIAPNGSLTNKHLFCPLGSDGMTIDSVGNVYLTGHGVTVFDKSGTQIQQIPVPENWTGNVCFSGTDRKTLFITASRSVYTLKMSVHGVGSQ